LEMASADVPQEEGAAAEDNQSAVDPASKGEDIADVPDGATAAAAAEPLEITENAQATEAMEPWSLHNTWHLPCFLKDVQYKLHLQVQTTVVMPMLTANVPAAMPFGEVALGQEQVRVFVLTNNSDEPVSVSASPLDPIGAFSLLGQPHPLGSNASQQLRVAFRPTQQCKYNEELLLRGPTNNVRFQLSGRGISPTYTFDMPHAGLDVGDCLIGESTEKVLNLVNTADFNLSYKINIINYGEQNQAAVDPFMVVPCVATVKAGESQQIRVVFQPDVPSEHFKASLRMHVASQHEELVYPLTGRGWAYAMYYYGGDPPSAQQESTVLNRFRLGSKDPGAGRQINLTFAETKLGPDESASREFEIGNCNGPNKKDAGEYAIEVSAEAQKLGFKIDPPSGSVENTKRKSVVVTYKPPVDDPEAAALGQWNEVILNAVLRKGAPAPPGDGWKFTVKLRAYMPGALERVVADGNGKKSKSPPKGTR
jgi:hypothetical protein